MIDIWDPFKDPIEMHIILVVSVKLHDDCNKLKGNRASRMSLAFQAPAMACDDDGTQRILSTSSSAKPSVRQITTPSPLSYQ